MSIISTLYWYKPSIKEDAEPRLDLSLDGLFLDKKGKIFGGCYDCGTGMIKDFSTFFPTNRSLDEIEGWIPVDDIDENYSNTYNFDVVGSCDVEWFELASKSAPSDYSPYNRTFKYHDTLPNSSNCSLLIKTEYGFKLGGYYGDEDISKHFTDYTGDTDYDNSDILAWAYIPTWVNKASTSTQVITPIQTPTTTSDALYKENPVKEIESSIEYYKQVQQKMAEENKIRENKTHEDFPFIIKLLIFIVSAYISYNICDYLFG